WTYTTEVWIERIPGCGGAYGGCEPAAASFTGLTPELSSPGVTPEMAQCAGRRAAGLTAP
ncbi:unnamed protein product, partial [Gadus morhua 'NCC']